MGNNCPLCEPTLAAPVLRESDHWRVALNVNQNLLGKLIIVLGHHKEAVVDLTEPEWQDLREQVGWATRRLQTAFAPDHFNYAFLQNQDRHVHLHVIPRYASERSVGGQAFGDAGWPGHYELGEVVKLSDETISAIASELT
ncbi:MAG TPA: HIT family protein [Candidatus Acidoferrum sp.]|jgi:diadenosine tetraphosphate (Ap4A) HIT family hydrolase|nr:HIT family protein [Candidatus Acidoferrum sp.]